MFSHKEIEKIAKLARVNLTSEEKDKFGKELSAILDYIKQLNQVDTDKVKPLYQTTGLVNAGRKDEPLNSFPLGEDLDKKLIGQAPHKQGRFVKVKSVFSSKK